MAAMSILTSLVDLAAAQLDERSVKQRQLEAEERKLARAAGSSKGRQGKGRKASGGGGEGTAGGGGGAAGASAAAAVAACEELRAALDGVHRRVVMVEETMQDIITR